MGQANRIEGPCINSGPQWLTSGEEKDPSKVTFCVNLVLSKAEERKEFL